MFLLYFCDISYPYDLGHLSVGSKNLACGSATIWIRAYRFLILYNFVLHNYSTITHFVIQFQY